MDIDEYAKNCHQDIVVDKAVPEYNRSTAELLCSRVVGLLERVAELEADLRVVHDLRDGQTKYLEQQDKHLADLQAQLERANGRIEIMHTLRSRMQEQLDRATEPRAVPGRYMADDGDGEREEFGTLAEAHEWADEQVRRYARDAAMDGEWPEAVNGVAVWVVVESTREIQDNGGSDFALEPCVVATEPRADRPSESLMDAARRAVASQESATHEPDDWPQRLAESIVADAALDETTVAYYPQEPRPMSEAPRDGKIYMVFAAEHLAMNGWREGELLGWLTTSSGEGES